MLLTQLVQNEAWQGAIQTVQRVSVRWKESTQCFTPREKHAAKHWDPDNSLFFKHRVMRFDKNSKISRRSFVNMSATNTTLSGLLFSTGGFTEPQGWLPGAPPKQAEIATTVLCGCSNIDTWIIAQGSMSNVNICWRFHCSKMVENIAQLHQTDPKLNGYWQTSTYNSTRDTTLPRIKDTSLNNNRILSYSARLCPGSLMKTVWCL